LDGLRIARVTVIKCITINDEEARQLSGEYSLVGGIQAMGPKYVVREHGVYCFMIFRFSLHQLFIGRGFDPTGAGDTFWVVLQDLLHKVKTYHSKT
jgi:sugar/nucleoside kinase (ribokinase family)